MIQSQEDEEEHVKKGLCFECHKLRHRSFECLIFKRKTITLEVKQKIGDESDGEPNKEEIPSISTAIMNMKVD